MMPAATVNAMVHAARHSSERHRQAHQSRFPCIKHIRACVDLKAMKGKARILVYIVQRRRAISMQMPHAPSEFSFFPTHTYCSRS